MESRAGSTRGDRLGPSPRARISYRHLKNEPGHGSFGPLSCAYPRVSRMHHRHHVNLAFRCHRTPPCDSTHGVMPYPSYSHQRHRHARTLRLFLYSNPSLRRPRLIVQDSPTDRRDYKRRRVSACGASAEGHCGWAIQGRRRCRDQSCAAQKNGEIGQGERSPSRR